jgi:hypothetical protein
LPIPKADEQKYRDQPFHDAQKPTRSSDAKDRVQPEHKWAVADVWDQYSRFVFKPLLVSEEHEYDDQRGSDQVIVKVRREKKRRSR